MHYLRDLLIALWRFEQWFEELPLVKFLLVLLIMWFLIGAHLAGGICDSHPGDGCF